MLDSADGNPKEDFNAENYYSLLELLDKLGKESVSELVSKGKPQRITRGDMIYFLKSDVNKILGKDLMAESSDELIVDDSVDSEIDFMSQLVFKQAMIRRHEVGKEEEIYHDRLLDFSQEIVFGRTKGHPQDQSIFKGCGVISSLHGKLYLDEDHNLLYENLGANKSKIRGCQDQSYTVLEKSEIGVLMSHEALRNIIKTSQPLVASIKLGFQVKPHFIVRIYVINKANEDKMAKLNLADQD
jgi:hypothetical protein